MCGGAGVTRGHAKACMWEACISPFEGRKVSWKTTPSSWEPSALESSQLRFSSTSVEMAAIPSGAVIKESVEVGVDVIVLLAPIWSIFGYM